MAKSSEVYNYDDQYENINNISKKDNNSNIETSLTFLL